MKKVIFCSVFLYLQCTLPFRLESPNSKPNENLGKTSLKLMLVAEAADQEKILAYKAELEKLGIFSTVELAKPDQPPAEGYVLVSVQKETQYKGSSKNFWISFPGVYIFMPGLKGYEYIQENLFKVRLSKLNESPLEETIQIDMIARHSDWNRSWLVPLDWFVTLGAGSLVGGLYMTRFDTDIQEEFQKQGSPVANKEFAVKLAERISEKFGETKSLPPLESKPMEVENPKPTNPQNTVPESTTPESKDTDTQKNEGNN